MPKQEKKEKKPNCLLQSSGVVKHSLLNSQVALTTNLGRFSNAPIIKALVVYMQDRGFNSFTSNMIKLSLSETK